MNRDDLPPQDKLVRLAYLALLLANSLKNEDPGAAEGALMMIMKEGAIYLSEPLPRWAQGVLHQCTVDLIGAPLTPPPPKGKPS